MKTINDDKFNVIIIILPKSHEFATIIYNKI